MAARPSTGTLGLMVARRTRADLVAAIGRFVQQYQRKAQKGIEPNDRRYDRNVETRMKRMHPEDLSEILSDDEAPKTAHDPKTKP